MSHAAELRACLETMDVDGVRRLWAAVSPHLAQPKDDEEAIATMHIARTGSESIHKHLRCYSHSWLTERGLPSHLPDQLKPLADRLYPRIVSAVGIAVKARNPDYQPAADEIRKAMEVAVMEADADGRLTDDEYVRQRMREARKRTIDKLYR